MSTENPHTSPVLKTHTQSFDETAIADRNDNEIPRAATEAPSGSPADEGRTDSPQYESPKAQQEPEVASIAIASSREAASTSTQDLPEGTIDPKEQQQLQFLIDHDSRLYPANEVLPPTHRPQAGNASSVPNPPGTKAKRKRASPHQLALLNQIYEHTSFPSTELRNAIGKELGMAPRTVQIWFQNKRQAWKSQEKSRDGQDAPAKSGINERGGWEVLRSFQARRANGEIQEYEYMSIPSPQNAGIMGHNGSHGASMMPFHPGMMQVALSSNDQFNSSMQQVPMPLPHNPRPYPSQNQFLHQSLQPENNLSAEIGPEKASMISTEHDLLTKASMKTTDEPVMPDEE